jgi:hypothetical protein
MERVLPQAALNAPSRRKSVFLEVGLVDEETLRRERSPAPAMISNHNLNKPRARAVRFRSKNNIFQEGDDASDDDGWESASDSDSDEGDFDSTQMRTALGRPRIYRLGFLAVVLGLMMSVFQMGTVAPVGVKGGVIPRESIEYTDISQFEKREDTQTNVCTRWAGQCKSSTSFSYSSC